MKYNLRSLKPKTEKLLDKLKELKLQLQDLFLPKIGGKCVHNLYL